MQAIVKRFSGRILFLTSVLIFTLPIKAFAGETETVLFGPEKFIRKVGRPQPQPDTKSFSVNLQYQKYELHIVNGADLSGLVRPCSGGIVQRLKCQLQNILAKLVEKRSKVSGVVIKLNGETVVTKPELDRNDHSLVKVIMPRAQNTLSVEISGGVGSFVTVRVVGVRQDTPNVLPVAQFGLSSAQGFAPLRVLFDASASSDADGGIVSYSWSFGDGTAVESGRQLTHEFLNVGSFQVALTVTDNRGGTNTHTKTVHVTNPVLPPDPATVAPPVSSTVPTQFENAFEFLYAGHNPVQLGVLPGTFEERRLSVIRGQVRDLAGAPLSGVKISVLNQIGWGHTLTRTDGRFDFAVNGGGTLTLQYERQGYFASQRQIAIQYNEFSEAPEVILLRPDPVVTKVILGSTAPQVIRGSIREDASGTRQATVILPPQTTAEIIMPSGSRRTATELSFRATEYTVGPNGPKSMPAPLPRSTAYTYAVDVSADEALALGSNHIEFNQPVPFYVENFLNFDIGSVVPVGAYDSARGIWVPKSNGRVVKILSVANSQAQLDVTGQGAPATPFELDELGVTSTELQSIALLYSVGQSLWRITTTEFSPIDLNWTDWDRDYYPDTGDDSDDPNDPPNQCSKKVQGSIIDTDTQTVMEQIPVVGAPFDLIYSSDRSEGRTPSRQVRLKLTGPIVKTDLSSIDVTVNVAGRTFSQRLSPAPNLTFEHEWDGKDAYGRSLYGDQKALITVANNYRSFYFQGLPSRSMVFGNMGARRSFSTTPARDFNTYTKTYTKYLSGKSVGFVQEGTPWSLNIHHRYDYGSRLLRRGDGGEVRAQDLGVILRAVAGSGHEGYSGDEGPALAANITSACFTVARDGSIYFADYVHHVIRRVGSDGIITTVAGNGTPGSSGDGGSALQAQLNQPAEVVVGPDGSLFVAEEAGLKIRKISPSGVISTVAGDGFYQDGGENVVAATASVVDPYGIIAAPDGSLYFAEMSFHRIRRIDPNGIISTVAGSVVPGYSGDGGLAIDAQFSSPMLMSMAPNGDLYVADSGNHVVRRIDANGVVVTVAGTPGVAGYGGDEGPALQAQLNVPANVVVARDGTIFIGDVANARIRRVTSDGTIQTYAGNGLFNAAEENVLATDTSVQSTCMALDQSDNLYVRDYNRIYKFELPLPDRAAAGVAIASSDASEIFVFDRSGLHLETKYAKTGATKYAFLYDANGRLSGVRDANGNLTQLVRSADGRLREIVSPYGQTTHIATDAQGLIVRVTNPNSESHSIGYGSKGLVSSFTAANGVGSTYAFDDFGYLTQVNPAGGGFTKFTRVTAGYDRGFEVLTETALGRQSRVIKPNSSGAGNLYQNQNEDGLLSTYRTQADGSTVAHLSSAIQISSKVSIDTRLGGGSVYQSSRRISTAQGTSSVQETRRYLDMPDRSDIFNYQQSDVTTVNNSAFSTVYDSSTRRTTSSTPLGRGRTSVVDEQERLVESKVGSLLPLQLEYDSRGRLESVSQGSRISRYAYNNLGFLESFENTDQRVESYEYDGAGRMTKKTLSDGRVIYMTYDGVGNMTSLTPPGRSAHAFQFNLFDLMSDYLPPVLASGAISTPTRYTYNHDRQLALVERPDGRSIRYNYELGKRRIDSISTDFGDYTFDYQATTGLLSLAGSPDHVVSAYAYNGEKIRQETVQFAGQQRSVTFGYNNDFQVSSTAISNGSAAVVSTYNLDKLLAAAGALTVTHRFDAPLVNTTTLHTTSDSYGYNGFGEVETYVSRTGSTAVYGVTLTRDDLGRIKIKSETIQGQANVFVYDYDNVGRLKDVTKNGVSFSSYAYDTNSNRASSLIGAQGATLGGSYDEQDRLLSYGDFTYGYNLNGDLETKTKFSNQEVTTYRYDSFGNLKSVALPDGRVVTYQIDHHNRRAGKSINGVPKKLYLYQSQLQVVGEYDLGTGEVTQFVYAAKGNVPDYMIRNGVFYRIVSDHLGSVRLVLNSITGAVIQRLDYDEFGQVFSDTSPGFQPFGFAGGLYDHDTGLVRFGARDYDPYTGRWTSKDPILFNGGDTNLYGYVINDPVNFIDPSGLLFESYIGARTTPNQQAAIGVGLVTGGVTAIRSGLLSLSPWLAIGGGLVAYEGLRNLQYAHERGITLPIPGLDDLKDFSSYQPSQENMCSRGP